jgi:hypothetical protein
MDSERKNVVRIKALVQLKGDNSGDDFPVNENLPPGLFVVVFQGLAVSGFTVVHRLK